MDASEGASLGIGNSMMDDMKGENEARSRHNMDVDAQIQAQKAAINTRVTGEKTQASATVGVGGSATVGEAIARGRGVVKAGQKAATAAGAGWDSMSGGAKASAALGQYANDSESFQAGRAAISPVISAGQRVASASTEAAAGFRGARSTGSSIGEAATYGAKLSPQVLGRRRQVWYLLSPQD